MKISTHKISSAIPRLERAPSGLPFAYSENAVLFLISCKMTTDLLENFHIFFGQKKIFLKLKISTRKTSSAIPLPRLLVVFSSPFAYSLYGVLFFICSKMATDLLDNFHRQHLNPISQVSKLFRIYHLLGFIRDTLCYNFNTEGYVHQVPFFHNIHHPTQTPLTELIFEVRYLKLQNYL